VGVTVIASLRHWRVWLVAKGSDPLEAPGEEQPRQAWSDSARDCWLGTRLQAQQCPRTGSPRGGCQSCELDDCLDVAGPLLQRLKVDVLSAKCADQPFSLIAPSGPRLIGISWRFPHLHDGTIALQQG